jgi:phosphotriesterase-related protein
MSVVRTLLADIPASILSTTYFHEHLIAQPPRFWEGWAPDLVLDDAEAISREIVDFQAIGGNCIVDGTAVDYGRDIAALIKVAERTHCHIVATAGYNKAPYFPPEIEGASTDQLQERALRDCREGMDGTTSRSGILKFGTSYYHMTRSEERAARAICRVQRATGLPLYTHTESGSFALEQIELLVSEHVDLTHVCIGHLDRNPDPWYLGEVAKTGVFLGFDQISKLKYFPDSVRVERILELVRAGYGRRILLSGDMARRSYLRAYGGGPGYRYIAMSFVPRLVAQFRECGGSTSAAERLGEDLLVNNPREFLTIG